MKTLKSVATMKYALALVIATLALQASQASPLRTAATVAAEPVPDARPGYIVVEHKEVVIARINEKGKTIVLNFPKGGSFLVGVGPKTWIIKDGGEASFADLRPGQRLHVRFIAATSQAVSLEVLSGKGEK